MKTKKTPLLSENEKDIVFDRQQFKPIYTSKTNIINIE
jgi:hypothetical protein